MSVVECTTLCGEKKLLPVGRLTFRPSAYAIIQHENQVLLLNLRSTGKLFLPGGVALGVDRSVAPGRHPKPRRDRPERFAEKRPAELSTRQVVSLVAAMGWLYDRVCLP